MSIRFVLGAALLLISSIAGAHVTVWPKTSAAGAHERYAVRVPNEKQSDTVTLEVRFPAGMKVTSFEQKAGWLTEPLLDSSGAITGARWTGRLPARQFTEFGLLAVNPPAAGEIVWTATQTYADGTRISWSGPAGSKTPAPRVTLGPSAR